MSVSKPPCEQSTPDLLTLVRTLAVELQPRLAAARPLSLDSDLERDLGLDSLSRLELIARIESAFGVSLPERVFGEAKTPRDLLRVLATANPAIPMALQQTVLDTGTRAGAPARAATLPEVLDWHADAHPDYPHVRVFTDQHGQTDDPRQISYAELQRGALRVAGDLQQRGLVPGETVAIMLPTGADYFFSFFGVLYAGGIPVPIYPPARLDRIEDHLQREAGILDNAGCRFLITFPQVKLLARMLKSQVESLQDLVLPGELLAPATFTPPRIDAGDTALLQYTSGSTGNPKGVVLSHANLLANIRVDGEAIEASGDDVFVSWLPLYHDMGLIGAWLGSLYFAAQLIIMSPLAFLARPARWLHHLHRYGGTLSAAPNFAYQLCLSRVADHELQGLDLSHWRIAMNGAEAVSPDTIESFSRRFAPFGFAAETMFPVYGLAECSVGLAFPALHQPPRIDRISRQSFTREGQAVPVAEDDAAALRFVGCGHALPGHEIRIVDDAGQELPERIQGRIQFRGPSATSGYYRNPEATGKLFDGDWLESGDLGYFAAGELYLTGRSKDMIIRGGRNIYPHELEEAIGRVDGVRKGCVAVFASTDRTHQTERLVVLAETRETASERRESMRQQINRVTADLTFTPADDIVLAHPGTVLKTFSGKIRRSACRALYESGNISKPSRAVWMQAFGLALAAAPQQAQQLLHRLRSLGYSMYARTLFYGLATVATLGVLGLPKLDWRWALLKRCARTLGRLSGTGLHVDGLQNLPAANRPCVYVANHASYIDSYVVTAALPTPFRFVAKAELTRGWLPRTFLQRLDTLFVERRDSEKGILGQRAIVQAARTGDSLCYFPEGTFTHVAGLRAFRMGAFVAAVESGLPVVPVALRGTRRVLAGSAWHVNRSEISVIIGAPLDPAALRRSGESDWQLAVRLKDLSRQQILAHCGEADMGHEALLPPDADEG